MNGIDLVIFDCDGVLVDSEIIALQIEADLLASAGCTITIEQLAIRFSGMNWREILGILEKERGLSLMDSLLDKTESILDARIPAEVKAIDGIRDALDGIGHKRCVCSNTKMERLEAMLSKVGLKNCFAPNIFSAKDLGEGRSKPKPDIFLFGARQMGVEPSRTIVIEDSIHGVHAACAAGMRVIGFTGGSHSYPGHAANLLRAGAHAIAPRMRDLPAIIAEAAGIESHQAV